MKYFCLIFLFYSSLMAQGFGNSDVDIYESIQEITPDIITRSKVLNEDKSYLFLFVKHPNNAYNYSNLNALRSSLIHNSSASKSGPGIGHVQASVLCNINGEKLSLSTGHTGESSDQFQKLISSGWGLSGFFAVFEDGELESSFMVNSDINYYLYEKKMSWVAFEISPSECKNIDDFLYKFIQLDAHKNFGFNLESDKFEGGACSALGNSILNRTSFSYLTKAWKRSLDVPTKLLGRGTPVRDVYFKPETLEHIPNKDISKLSLFLKSWNSEKISNLKLDIYDPEILLYQINDQLRYAYYQKPDLFPSNYELPVRNTYSRYRDKGKGYQDKRQITSEYDKHYEQVFKINQEKIYPRIRKQKFKVDTYQGVTGIIFEK